MYPGRVGAVSKSKDEVKINFDDGDELVVPWAACRLRDAPRTSTYSFKRPQSLSDSLSYAGLTDSQLKPRAQPAHESALKWIGFAATLAAIFDASETSAYDSKPRSFACFCLRTYSWRSSMDILSRFGFSSGLGVDARALWDPGGSIFGVFGRSVFDNKGSTETAEAAARSRGGNTHDLGVGAGSMISHCTSASTVSFVSV